MQEITMESAPADFLLAAADELEQLGDVVRNGPEMSATDQIRTGQTIEKIGEILRVEVLRVRALEKASERNDALERRLKVVEQILEADTWAGKVRDLCGFFLDLQERVEALEDDTDGP